MIDSICTMILLDCTVATLFEISKEFKGDTIEEKTHHPVFYADIDDGAKTLGRNHLPLMVSLR